MDWTRATEYAALSLLAFSGLAAAAAGLARLRHDRPISGCMFLATAAGLFVLFGTAATGLWLFSSRL